MIIKPTKHRIAYEAAKYIDQDLVMLGTEALQPYLSDLDSKHLLSSEHSFVAVYGLEEYFYYKIERISKGKSVVFEVGVGLVKENSGNITFERVHPILYQYKDEQPRVILNQTPPYIRTHKDDIIIISSYIPSSLLEALPASNVIITAIGPHQPHPVEIAPNSVLGRQDDDIESIKIQDLPSCAKSYPTVQDAPEIKGIIIYDEEWDKLRYYNGEEWRSLGW